MEMAKGSGWEQTEGKGGHGKVIRGAGTWGLARGRIRPDERCVERCVQESTAGLLKHGGGELGN